MTISQSCVILPVYYDLQSNDNPVFRSYYNDYKHVIVTFAVHAYWYIHIKLCYICMPVMTVVDVVKRSSGLCNLYSNV